jgi:ABC-type polysaccharide/polyol phosphate transport system ATPase subunit
MSCEVDCGYALDGGIAPAAVWRSGSGDCAMTGSSTIAIRARGLTKTFRVYLKPSDVLRELFSRERRSIERHALRDVSFDVRRGEVVGVLGRNGAGKSTLLKIIAGTLDRTAGELEVSGRITAILELGTGFHPDYSGRENIRLGGLCLGMSRDEVERKTDSIIEFSELRDVIDQPFRTYSTGMQARLTFATAISVDPDILIIDEALSVGDARFQAKCFARMTELRNQGRTILLVSHDTNTITTFCDRALVLEAGRVYAEGEPRQMSIVYHNLLFGAPSVAHTNSAGLASDVGVAIEAATALRESPRAAAPPATQEVPESADPPALPREEPAAATSAPGGSMHYGDGAVQIVDYGIYDAAGRRCATLPSGAAATLQMQARVVRPLADASFGFAIKDRRGTVLWGVTNAARNEYIGPLDPGDDLLIKVPLRVWLSAGDYFVTLGFAHLESGEKCDFIEDAIQFKVIGPGGIFTTGVVNLQSGFEVMRNTVRIIGEPSASTPAPTTQWPAWLLAAAPEIEAAERGDLSEAARYRLAEQLSMAVYPTFKFSEFARIWLKDEGFLRYYERFMDPGNWHSLDRKFALKELLKLVVHLPGDLAEVGVYKGASAWLMCEATAGTTKTVHLFDSFEGLSEPLPVDGSYWFRGALSVSDEHARQNLSRFGNAKIYKGWVPERFQDVADRCFCFVHVDVDLYEPTRASVEFFYERLVTNGLMVFDDYGFETCPGARQAVDEFFATRPEALVMLPTGQALIQKLASKPSGFSTAVVGAEQS